MKATDLMIGDWVYVNGLTQQVFDLAYNQNEKELTIGVLDPQGEVYQCFYGFDHVEPIPLDCEIMWKNGFEDYNTTLRESWKKCSDFTERSLEHPMEVNERYAIVKVMFQENSFGVEIHTGKPTEDLRALACDKSATSNMRYVHELQHALRLCGIEKEIKL